MKKLYFSILSVLFILSLLFWNYGLAEEFKLQRGSDAANVLTLDGIEYKKSQVIEDFIKIAFPPDIHLQKSGKPFSSIIFWISQDKHQDVLGYNLDTWWGEYVYRTKGLPQYGVISKWDGDSISVGFNWPLPGYGSERTTWTEDLGLGNAVSLRELYDDTKLVVQSLAEQLSVSGINIVFNDIDSQKEKSENYAKVRIIPGYKGTKTYFNPVAANSVLSENKGEISQHLYKLAAGLEMTPNLSSQVEGIVLPKSDNNIGMAFCNMPPHIVGNERHALLAECILRSLGLTNVSKSNKNSLLSDWNGLDNKKIQKWQPISQYDSLMVQLLYCPSIKSGMDPYKVAFVLSKSDECFGEYLKKGE